MKKCTRLKIAKLFLLISGYRRVIPKWFSTNTNVDIVIFDFKKYVLSTVNFCGKTMASSITLNWQFSSWSTN
jgi:hypothetical protein